MSVRDEHCNPFSFEGFSILLRTEPAARVAAGSFSARGGALADMSRNSAVVFLYAMRLGRFCCRLCLDLA